VRTRSCLSELVSFSRGVFSMADGGQSFIVLLLLREEEAVSLMPAFREAMRVVTTMVDMIPLLFIGCLFTFGLLPASPWGVFFILLLCLSDCLVSSEQDGR